MRSLGTASARLAWLALALLLVGCRLKPASVAGVLRGLQAPAGWTRGDVEVFDRQNLYDLVDGQADAFFVYGFEQVATAGYENVEGARLDAAVWQLATPEDAYGLFSANRSGVAVPIGNDGEADPGRRLAFWQNRYYVCVWARQELPDGELWAFARGLAGALPSGGKQPALLSRLPQDLQQARPLIFFHEEFSIQSELWLGGENLLGLSPETEAVLVRLPVDGGVAHLLLVQYPDLQAASAAQGALQAGQVEGLVAFRGRDNLLGAVFGAVDGAAADRWLRQTLAAERE